MPSSVLETVSIPINEIKPHPDNPRKGDVELIKESLEEHGQYRAVVVNKQTNEILAGTHTWLAAQELGWDRVLVHWVEVTPEGAKKLLLVDNRSNDVSGYFDEKLASILEEMMLAGQLKGSGWDAETVDNVLAEMDALPQVEGEPFLGDYAETAEETAARYKAPEDVQPLRQFVFLFPQAQGYTVEGQIKILQKAWGISAVRDVIAEALRQSVTILIPPIDWDEDIETVAAWSPEELKQTTEGRRVLDGNRWRVVDGKILFYAYVAKDPESTAQTTEGVEEQVEVQ